MSGYILCYEPEDENCSDGLTFKTSIDNHLTYFGVNVGTYCENKNKR